jgi:hypothetical protein
MVRTFPRNRVSLGSPALFMRGLPALKEGCDCSYSESLHSFMNGSLQFGDDERQVLGVARSNGLRTQLPDTIIEATRWHEASTMRDWWHLSDSTIFGIVRYPTYCRRASEMVFALACLSTFYARRHT